MGIALRAGLVSTRACRPNWVYECVAVYISMVAEHLVDIDEDALTAARAELGTTSMKATVNERGWCRPAALTDRGASPRPGAGEGTAG